MSLEWLYDTHFSLIRVMARIAKLTNRESFADRFLADWLCDEALNLLFVVKQNE